MVGSIDVILLRHYLMHVSSGLTCFLHYSTRGVLVYHLVKFDQTLYTCVYSFSCLFVPKSVFLGEYCRSFTLWLLGPLKNSSAESHFVPLLLPPLYLFFFPFTIVALEDCILPTIVATFAGAQLCRLANSTVRNFAICMNIEEVDRLFNCYIFVHSPGHLTWP